MSSRATDPEDERDGQHPTLRLWLLSLAATAILFAVAVWLMGPPPPDRLVFAAGPQDGVYFRRAGAYRDVLARQGIQLDVRATAGSVENLRLLQAGTADLAFVQGGTAEEAQRADLRSIAAVFLEPLWVFQRRGVDLDDFTQMQGLRIAVGPEGSGTRSLALRLLEGSGIVAPGSGGDDPRLRPVGGSAAAAALLAGEVDVAFFVVAPEAAYLHDLLLADDVGLVPLRRHEALVRRHRFLADVDLPEGVLDLAANVPRGALHVIAPTAALVARESLHPAVVPLFIEAAREIEAGGSLLAEPGTFPSPHRVDVRLADDARRYFDQGPTWLYRVFPFWLASFLDRAVILLLPLVTLLFPLLKTAPPLYRWGVRRRIYRWYREVREADALVRQGTSTAQLESELATLRGIEAEVGGVSIPLSYMREFYDLRLHLDFVRRRVEQSLAGRAAAAGSDPGGAPVP